MNQALLLLIGLVMIGGVRGSAQERTSTILERIIVRVNGEILTQTELQQRQIDLIRQRNQDSQNLSDARIQELVNEVTPEVLVTAVDDMLLSQRGRELGATLAESQFQQMISDLKKDNNLDDAAFQRALAEEGLTLQELRQNFERVALIQEVQRQEIFRRMNVTEEELRQYFNAHRETFMTKETVTVRELALAAPTRTQAGQTVVDSQDAAALRERMQGVLTRVKAGEDFTALIQELSVSPTKANGGIIGPVNLDEVNPAVRTAIEKLAVGSVSDPVELAAGRLQIFRLEERDAPRMPPFEEVRERIEQEVRNERLGVEMDKLLARLRAQAVIEWKDEDLRRLYQQRLSEQVPQ